MIAGVEGRLSIEIDGIIFFQEPGILLLELAEALIPWIQGVNFDGEADFYYASMDFEEEPIVSFNYKKNAEVYKLGSVWGSGDFDVRKGDLVNAAMLFISELKVSIDKRLAQT